MLSSDRIAVQSSNDIRERMAHVFFFSVSLLFFPFLSLLDLIAFILSIASIVQVYSLFLSRHQSSFHDKDFLFFFLSLVGSGWMQLHIRTSVFISLIIVSGRLHSHSLSLSLSHSLLTHFPPTIETTATCSILLAFSFSHSPSLR